MENVASTTGARGLRAGAQVLVGDGTAADRGVRLEQVLELAEALPVRHATDLRFPPLVRSASAY
jgi:hypothetical protein